VDPEHAAAKECRHPGSCARYFLLAASPRSRGNLSTVVLYEAAVALAAVLGHTTCGDHG